jgi:hypothetical protein
LREGGVLQFRIERWIGVDQDRTDGGLINAAERLDEFALERRRPALANQVADGRNNLR